MTGVAIIKRTCTVRSTVTALESCALSGVGRAGPGEPCCVLELVPAEADM